MATGYKRRLRGIGAVAAACLASLLVLSSVASAAVKYPQDAAVRGFNQGVAGWTASSSFDGTCLPPLLCPSAANSFQPSDEGDGGGFIRSAYTGVAGVMAVGGTTTAVWQSPSFTYSGLGGAVPGEVAFEMDRRASVDQLLAVAGNSATYSVRLIDLSDGNESLPLIAPATLAGAKAWRATSASVEPDQLVVGHDYKIAITTAYSTGTTVLVTGNADYDNVALSVDRGGKGRGGGGAGAGGDGGLDRQRLIDLMRDATPGTATLKGKSLFVRVNCPRKLHRSCRMAVQGLLGKRKPATARRSVKLRKGKSKLVKLLVRPKAQGKVAKRKRLLVRQKVRAGKVTATIYKKRRLIRR